jgi:exonuclease SbcD
MPDKIRLLHFADIHVGMENYGHVDSTTGINSRVIDFLRRFDEVIDYGLARDVDVVIFAGDAFKARDPSPTLQREFARRVKRIADAGAPLLLLVGNHDLPAMEKKASSVDIYRTLAVPNVIVGWEEALHRVETKRGPLQIAAAPYPMRQRLMARDEYRGQSVEELDRALQDIVADNIRALAEQLDPALPAVLAGHFTVSGATYGSERSVMIGRDVAVLKSVLADPRWDYVALGHIHKHQSLQPKGDTPAIVYSGSLERIDFGEEREAKGFCWVEVEKGATTWQFVEVKARPFKTIVADVRQADDVTMAAQAEIAQHDVSGAVVRVVVRLRAEQEASLREREVRAVLKAADTVAAIQKDVERVERARLGGQNPEGLRPLELLERYLRAKDTSEERIRTLTEHAKKVMSDE